MSYKNVALFTKNDKLGAAEAAMLLREFFSGVEVFSGETGAPFPAGAASEYDLIISYLSPWIIPKNLLDSAALAINFHPGPPAYPGVGCFNFALYDNAAEYGATCHHMLPKVDTGKIIRVSTFPVNPKETVLSLSIKSYAKLFEQLAFVADAIAKGEALPESRAVWERRPYTRKELNALCEIRPDMDPDEIARRVRATAYPGAPGARLELAGFVFNHENPYR